MSNDEYHYRIGSMKVSLFRHSAGGYSFSFDRYREGDFKTPYISTTVTFEDAEDVAAFCTGMSRFLGCEVQNPYEEAAYYADSELSGGDS